MYDKLALFKRVVSTCRVPCMKKGSSNKLLEFLADMPKGNSPRTSDSQSPRVRTKRAYENISPSTIYLQVVGSGARGAANTLYLFTDQKRYIFNCGEGTQRLAHEHKVRLGKLEHIFITSKTWRNIGGLPGMSLTLQDVGIPKLTLHGPEGLDELYNATKRFVVIKDMIIKKAECSPSEDFNDNVMNVKYVLLGPEDNVLENDLKPAAKRPKLDVDSVDKAFEEFIHDDTDYYDKRSQNIEENKNKNHKSKLKSPEKDSGMTKTEKVLKTLQKRSNCTVAYICTFQKRLGNLDLKKCVERGVTPGPLLGKLKAGEDVLLPDGTLVLSKDVKTPDDPGPVIIVLEVPDLTYLKESEFSAHFDNGANPPESVPAIIVHYTPPHVFHHPTYRAFMSMFGPRTRHLVLNSQNSCLGSEAVHRTQHKLHLLDPDIFPLLKDLSVPAVWRAHPPVANTESPSKLKGLEELKVKIAVAQFQNIINMEGSCKGDGATAVEDPSGDKPEVIAGRTLSIFHLRPKKEFDRSAEPKLVIQEYIQEAMDMDGFATSLEQFRKLVDGMRYAQNGTQKEYPKVVFLGTGSCIPSKIRNTSAIVLHIDEDRSMLLDCGEGTFNQMVRFYGPKRVDAFLRTLKAIYVSHLHADHHLGLIGVLQARRQALQEAGETGAPLHLLAPGQIVSWLATYDAQFERIRDDFALLPNQNLLETDGEAPTAVLASIGVRGVRTCYVTHCPNAFGVAIDLDGQHKITYSGDTIPCDQLVNIGIDSTLLIHEATMEDELADEARFKMHSTTSQAIDIGRSMSARYTVLTHFSQRYARLPRLNAHILHNNTSVGIAFDNMQITMSDLELLPHMYAPLQLMFAEHCVEMELKAQQREMRAQLNRSQSSGTDNSKNPGKNRARAPSPMYRDSNASRLRQEIRKMSDSAPPVKWRRMRSRSESCSSNRSANSATSKSQSSDNATPMVGPSEIGTTRTAIMASNLNKEERSKGHVIDTRSKTLNSASLPSTDKVPEKKINNINSTLSSAPKEARGGYGKPLVTPVNKHLIIRKSGVQPSNAGNEKLSPATPTSMIRCRSPVKSWKEENRPAVATVNSTKPDSQNQVKTKLPAKDPVPANRAQCSNAALGKEACRRPKSSAPTTMSKSPVGSAQRRPVSPRRSSSADRKVPQAPRTPIGSHASHSPTAGHLNKEANIKYPGKSADTLSEKQKKHSIGGCKTKFGNASSKSFKPSLEDIKSSYLLLNKKKLNRNINTPVNDENKPKAPNPPMDDNLRRIQLVEIKQKYKSKRFWNDSKYDKIEGLNWITWK